MRIVSVLALSGLVAGFAHPSLESPLGLTRKQVSDQTRKDLEAILSKNTTFTGPEDPDYANETERYQSLITPEVQLSVRPGTEGDVAKIVKYANSKNIEFWAVNRGHALTTSPEIFRGIEINLRSLTSISINADQRSAHLQGGVYGYEVINYFWPKGLVAATGTCSCVGTLGPALGGGHGPQQGLHGLTQDQMNSYNVVLANGSAITVNATSNPDLWWGMRGAGHNFGIVTSFDQQIWPNAGKTYFIRTYQFPGNATLEPLIKAINKFQGNGTLSTSWIGSFGTFSMNKTVSTKEAVITWTFGYNGAKSAAAPQLTPFDALNPSSVVEATIPYNQLQEKLGGGLDSALCEANLTHIVGTAGLQVYNVTAERQIYNLYNSMVAQHPQLSNTNVVHEGYSVAGVLQHAPEDSAFAQRDDYLLMYFDIVMNDRNSPLLSVAEGWRNKTVNLWNQGQPGRPVNTYVNYAAGRESLESRYGYEPWRLERLRGLKAKYDPQNRFRYYNPIIQPTS